MSCPLQNVCGGCLFRHLSPEEYQAQKVDDFKRIISGLNQPEIRLGEPVFIGDNTRRRASIAFSYNKGRLTLGFNQRQSDVLVDIQNCALLTPKLNANLDNLRRLLHEVCSSPITLSAKKGSKASVSYIKKGDVWLCEADNGIDVVLEFPETLTLEHRMILFELVQGFADIIRISHRTSASDLVEPIIEKAKPVIKMGQYDVFIPAGTFLQASKASEVALVGLVQKYLGMTTGRIADLFCGVGTFSYPLAQNKNNQITAVDSSKSLLAGFRQSVHKNMIPNIEIIEKNLFKYPLDEKEISSFDAVIFDPPRAGAAAQVEKIASAVRKPARLVAVSCNPHSFVKDANVLLSAGYKIGEITLVDQFSYSNHSELVAVFELLCQ